jgi:hypothetical protein
MTYPVMEKLPRGNATTQSGFMHKLSHNRLPMADALASISWGKEVEIVSSTMLLQMTES